MGWIPNRITTFIDGLVNGIGNKIGEEIGSIIIGVTHGATEETIKIATEEKRCLSEDDAVILNMKKKLEDCIPLEAHVTRPGLDKFCYGLEKNDALAAQFAIDTNPGPSKNDGCVWALKTVAGYLCSPGAADVIRQATYTYAACPFFSK